MPLFNWINSNLHNDNQDWIIKKIKSIEQAVIDTARDALSAAASASNAGASAESAAESAGIAQAISDDLSGSITSAVSAWLLAHITPTTPALDSTLSISGAAAEAAAVGRQAMIYHARDNAVTSSKMLKAIGCYNINTSWYADLTTDFGSGKLGSMITFGNPTNSQEYQILYLETGKMYTRWIHKTADTAGAWKTVMIDFNDSTFLNLKNRGSATDSKTLNVGFYNTNTNWYTDLQEDLGPDMIGILFVYGNRTGQYYQMFIQETGDVYQRSISSGGVPTAFIHTVKGQSRAGSYIAFGDSRTYGLRASGGQSAYRYPRMIADDLHMAYANMAISGSGLFERPDRELSAAIDTIRDTDISAADLITIEYGVNDYQHPIGSYTDTGNDTFCGRLYQVINYINTTNPSAALVVIASANTAEGVQSQSWGYGFTTESGWSLGALIEEERKLCAKYHIPFIDGYDCPVNDFNIRTLMPDRLHYDDQGYLMRSRYLTGKVKAFYGFNQPDEIYR